MNTIKSIERRMYIFSKKIISLIIYCLISILFFSCDETNMYYDTLKDQPEFLKDYDAVYSVGDTMHITGRLNRDDLKVYIGDAPADIISIKNVLHNVDYKDTIQLVELLISDAMGIGVNRSVKITSSGITLNGPSIEIVEDANSGLLKGELTVRKIADYPVGSTPVYCRSGNGNMYFMNDKTYAISRMTPDGTLEQVFDIGKCVDNDGSAFSFTRFNSCGIDPNEQYLYLSLYTEAPSKTYWHYYRFCRWDLKNKVFTVLNKTPYYIYRSKRTLSDVQPMEGNIGDVKVFTITGIYPDSLGNVYFNINNQMITSMEASGNYRYIFKNSYPNYKSINSDPAPQIVNPETDEYYTTTRTLQFFPGVIIGFSNVETFAPDEKQLYTRATTARFQLYDMVNQVLVSNHNKYLNTSNGEKIYISGSFDVLTGGTPGSVNTDISQWGLLPLSSGKLLLLYYQDLADSQTYKKYNMPAWGVLDFIAERGYRYAPGTFDRKGYVMQATDQLLNYDDDTMLYMTANDKSVILKTEYK